MSRRGPLLAAAVLLAACAGVGVWAAGRGSAPAPLPPLDPRSAGPLGPATDALGINEAVSVPLLLEQRQAAPPLERLGADAAQARAVGATWTRGHTYSWPRLSHDRWLREGRSWDRMDAWVGLVQAAGLQALAMIGPWPGNHTRDATSSFVLPDPAAYQAFVQAAVERYDGDGVDDMPGLRAPIHAWEIDNEPDLKNLADLRTGTADDFATPAQFAAVLRTTAAAIRAADPDAVVVGGGFNRVTQDHGHAYMVALFAEPGVLEALDVVSVHAYHQGPGLDDLVTTLQRTRAVAPGAPIWVTETSVPAAGERAWLDEDWQARVAVATVLECLSWGVEKVFWHTLFDPPPAPGRQPRSNTRTSSLLARTADGGLRQKPAAVAYKALAALLEGVDRRDVTTHPATGGRAWRVGADLVVLAEADATVTWGSTSGRDLLSGAPVPVTSAGERRTVGPGLVVLTP